jgi:hypothetical protein
MEHLKHRTRLRCAFLGAGLHILLFVTSARSRASQSAAANIEESQAEMANDPTATLTQLEVKDTYTIS